MLKTIMFEIKKKAILKYTKYIIRLIKAFQSKSELMKDGGNTDFFNGSCETCEALISIIKANENRYISALEFGEEDGC